MDQSGKLAATIGELADRGRNGSEQLEQALAPLRAALGREDPTEGS
jgi:hypothetical protein